MITKLYKAISTMTLTSLLLGTLAIAPVSAQSSSNNDQGSGQAQTGSGQDACASFAQSIDQKATATGANTAATPIANCWLSIGPGQKQWYKFHAGARSSTGDEDNDKNNSNEVDDSDAAFVRLAMDVPGCVTFEVWTLDRLNAPPPVGNDASREDKRKDKEIARGPVGVGSPEFAIVDDNSSNSDSKDKSTQDDKNRNLARLLWRGGSTVPENFYVAVRNVRTDFACQYRLAVTGTTVSFPGSNNAAMNNGSNMSNSNASNNNNSNNDDSNNNKSNNDSNNDNSNSSGS
ncbi:MAG: hypothetical protein NT075_12345 [Chloroflexi bacterium]|nr:hypothetical protein [Chloroflexota bacterium]